MSLGCALFLIQLFQLAQQVFEAIGNPFLKGLIKDPLEVFINDAFAIRFVVWLSQREPFLAEKI